MRNPLGIPTYDNMMCELLQALKKLGGSGTISEIDDKTIEILALLSEVQEVMHGNSSKTEVEDIYEEGRDSGELLPGSMVFNHKGKRA